MKRTTIALCGLLSFLAIGCDKHTAPVSIDRIVLTPGTTPTLLVGPGGAQRVQFTATALQANGAPVESALIVWTTTTPSRIDVSPSGVVVAKSPGIGLLRATSRGATASARVVVSPVPISSLRIALDTIYLEVGPLGASTRVLSAVMRDSIGNRLTDRPVRWSSSDPSIVDVSPNGGVTAINSGSAFVYARSETKLDSALVLVYATAGIPVGVDVSVTGAEWTQGVQTPDHAIPMLSGGRAAVVNVSTFSTSSLPGSTLFALRMFAPDGKLVYSDTASARIESGATSAHEPTLQFLVPASHLQPGTRWQIVRDPNGEARDASEATDVLPASGPAALDVLTPPPLRLHFVPIELASHGFTRGNVTPAVLEEYLVSVRAMIPNGEIEATIGTPHTTAQSFGSGALGGDRNFWVAVLNELDAKRLADPHYSDAHWIGVVRPPAGFSYTTYGGFAFVPSSGDDTGPFTRTSVVIGVHWFLRESATREIVAHELGHNLGRLHAPCGITSGADANYPRPGGLIGDGGTDTYAWESGQSDRAPAIPQNTADLMGYCIPVWLSAYSYLGMLQFRGARDDASALRMLETKQRVLLVRGEVKGRSVSISRPKVLVTSVTPPDDAGEWLVEGRTASGTLIFQRRFALARYDHADDARPFAAMVPLDEPTEQQLASLRVTGPDGSAQRAYPD